MCDKFIWHPFMWRLSLTLAFIIAAVGVIFFALSKPPKQVTAQKQPQSWNSNAIRSSFEGVQIREIDPAHAEVVFSYDLENTTDSDYLLGAGPNVVVLTQLKSDGSLKPQDLFRIHSPVFLSAKNRARVALSASQPFNWPSQMIAGQIGPITQGKFRSLVGGIVSEVQEFVLIDEVARYKIELPGDWQELPPASVARLN